jgi:hypothetical protein
MSVPTQSSDSRHRLLGLWLLSAAALWLYAVQARASCVPPAAEVLWSYPAQGAQDVPTDATFWLLAVGSLPRASLEGRALALEQTGTFSAFTLSPGALTANKDYVLKLELPPSEGAQGATKSVEIAFRTGAGAGVTKPAAPTIVNSTQTVEALAASTCPEILAAQDCFDTGQSANKRFELAAQADALAYLVLNSYSGASNVWPSRCGAPTVRVHAAPELSRSCFTLQAIGKGGALGPETMHCPPAQASADAGTPVAEAAPTDARVATPVDSGPAPTPPTSTQTDTSGASAGTKKTAPPDPADDGCSLRRGRPRSFALWLLPLLALVTWQRRRARFRHR